jgi:hypothetical protein
MLKTHPDKMKAQLVSILFFLFTITVLPVPGKVYLFSYFKGNGEDGLHLAYSRDGLAWTTLNNDKSFLKPVVGVSKLMRDPCIIMTKDGMFHMVWTAGWTERGIGYASSKDLVNWSEQKYIEVMANEPTARNTWAPEIIYDEKKKQFTIFWATTIPGRFPETDAQAESKYNHRIYCTTTKDFVAFSETRLFYEPGFNVIDATIQKNGKSYIMFLKDETVSPPQKNIKTAISNTIAGPFSKASGPITGNYWAEGPTSLKIGKTWYVWFDKYRDRKYGAVTSTDLAQWTDISDKIVFPEGARHGTVLEVDEKIIQALLAR